MNVKVLVGMLLHLIGVLGSALGGITTAVDVGHFDDGCLKCISNVNGVRGCVVKAYCVR